MPSKPLRLAVLSDLHIDCDADPQSWELAKAAFRAAQAEGANHIVVVGDVFDCSTAMARDQGIVRTYLRRRGVWHRDRLTLVVGNHDIFHTAHRSDRFIEGMNIILQDAQQMYELFCHWAGELVDEDDRFGEYNLFPTTKLLGHVRLSCIDTTETNTADSTNGRVDMADIGLLSGLGEGVRHVLAMHNAPFEGRISTIKALDGDAGGFSKTDLRRLQRLVNGAEVEAIVCGHIHNNLGDPYEWELAGGQPVYLMGRTGGVHDTTPVIGLLDVPQRGRIRWREVEI